MKLLINTTIYLLAAGLLAVAATPGVAAADEFACIKIYPCDDQGELLSMFEGQTDDCAVQFAAQCKKVRAEARKGCASVSEDYNKLQEKIESQKTRYTILQRKFKKLKNSK